MADRLLVHPGPPRTGSGYVQRLLWSHREDLAAHDVHLPLGERRGQRAAAVDLLGREHEAVPHRWRWDRLAAAVRETPGTAVWSTDLLSGADDAVLGRLVAEVAPTPVQVVLGAGDLARQLPAMWQQHVRQRGTWDFDAFLTALRDGREPAGPDGGGSWWDQQPLALVRRWTAHVPPEAVTVVVVPPRGSEPGLLWRRFRSALGLPADIAYDEPTGSPAAALGPVEGELLRRVNAALASAGPGARDDEPDPDEGEEQPGGVSDRTLREQLVVPGLLEPTQSRRLRLPAAHREWVARANEQMVAGLAELAVPVVGDLAELSFDDAETEEGGAGDEELLDLAVDVLARTLRHVDGDLAALRSSLQDSRAELDRLQSRMEEDTDAEIVPHPGWAARLLGRRG